jgi:hypothetical protein
VQKVPESPGPEVLVGAPADAVAIHDDDRRLVERVVRNDRFAHVRQLDLHTHDAGKEKNVPAVRIFGEAEFGADRIVTAALRTRDIPGMNNQFEGRRFGITRQAIDRAISRASSLGALLILGLRCLRSSAGGRVVSLTKLIEPLSIDNAFQPKDVERHGPIYTSLSRTCACYDDHAAGQPVVTTSVETSRWPMRV